jgi:hypothetical protein
LAGMAFDLADMTLGTELQAGAGVAVRTTVPSATFLTTPHLRYLIQHSIDTGAVPSSVAPDASHQGTSHGWPVDDNFPAHPALSY